MLLHLHIKNVAIIEESSVSLDSGLNVFTGETGAGKSILIDSLLLALGGRASTDLVRTGAPEARVSALFSILPNAPYIDELQRAGIPTEDELLLRRIITASGRSRAYINERPVTVAFLRKIGQRLCEISGQHEHQHLLHPRMHLDVLDGYGELTEERKAVTAQYEAVRALRQELEELGGDAHNRARRRGYLQYQIDELEEAELEVDEEELEHSRKYMMQVEQMIEASQGGESMLYSGPQSVLESIGRLQHKLANFRELAPDLDAACKSLEEAEALLDDSARTLRYFAEDTSFDPNELESLQERLTQLRDLKRKHGVNDITGLRQCLQEYKNELVELDQREERMTTLEANYHNEVESLKQLAEDLSAKRYAIRETLARDVEGELASLGMKKATFLVTINRISRQSFDELEPLSDLPEDYEESTDADTHEEENTANTTQSKQAADLPGPSGYDQVQFLLSSNPGETPRPMHKIASGGELSRIMLSLKQVIAERDPVNTCIFDEVDAGIGGVTGATIGQKINEISCSRQVLCITHLPQIACFANHHFHIKKQEEEGRTHSTIEVLETKTRERELARMLGGMAGNEQSLAHARELLDHAREHTETLMSKANGTPTAKCATGKTKAKSKAKTEAKPKKTTKANGTKSNGTKQASKGKKDTKPAKKKATKTSKARRSTSKSTSKRKSTSA